MKVGNGGKQEEMPPMPPQQDSMMGMGEQPQGMPTDDNGMGETPNIGEDPNVMPQDSIPQDGQSEFDTNFDAGVEADEDTDPKKYIQQLTGKLSTTLNSYNNENGADKGLNKYVAKMIVKQSVKGMDDNFKKEIIKAINTADDGNSETKEQEPTEGEKEQKVEELQETMTKKQYKDIVNKIRENLK